MEITAGPRVKSKLEGSKILTPDQRNGMEHDLKVQLTSSRLTVVSSGVSTRMVTLGVLTVKLWTGFGNGKALAKYRGSILGKIP